MFSVLIFECRKKFFGDFFNRFGILNRTNSNQTNFLAKIPIKFPNFDLDILNVTAEDNRVHVHVKLSADNLDSEAVHMFVVEDGLETEFRIVDDSQKIAKALGG